MGAPLPEVLDADLWTAAAFTAALLSIIGAGEFLRSRLHVPPTASRRVIHFLTGVLVAAAPLLFRHPHFLVLLAAVFVVANFMAVRYGWLRSMHGIDGGSFGTAIFPLALLVAIGISWWVDEQRVFALQCAFLILAVSDPFAAIVGNRQREPRKLSIGSGTKSLAGSLAFFLSASLLLAGSLFAFRALGLVDFAPVAVVLIAIGVAAVAACAEALATRGWDNLFVVLAVMIPLIFLHEHPPLINRFLFSVILAVVFGLAAVRIGFLDLSGGLAAFLLAVAVVGFGGWPWAVPSFVFFLLSSLLSALRKSAAPHRALHDAKGSTRDAGQVYANGGVGLAAILGYVSFPDEIWYWVFVGSFAAATADTWATEVGTMFKRTARNIMTWQRVEAGASGGVSVPGTAAAVIGAGVIGLMALWVGGGAYAMHPHPALLLMVMAAGFTASVADSIAGATIQGRYVDGAAGGQTERSHTAGRANRLVGGYPWMTNDRVNWLCTITGGVLASMMYQLSA